MKNRKVGVEMKCIFACLIALLISASTAQASEVGRFREVHNLTHYWELLLPRTSDSHYYTWLATTENAIEIFYENIMRRSARHHRVFDDEDYIYAWINVPAFPREMDLILTVTMHSTEFGVFRTYQHEIQSAITEQWFVVQLYNTNDVPVEEVRTYVIMLEMEDYWTELPVGQTRHLQSLLTLRMILTSSDQGFRTEIRDTDGQLLERSMERRLVFDVRDAVMFYCWDRRIIAPDLSREFWRDNIHD
jgi:hypothetical protein